MSIHDNLGYLLVNLCKVHKRRGERAFRKLGLYAGQDLVLAELWERETVNQADLVERLWVQPPTVTKILNRLEKAGLIERRTDPESPTSTRCGGRPSILTRHSDVWTC